MRGWNLNPGRVGLAQLLATMLNLFKDTPELKKLPDKVWLIDPLKAERHRDRNSSR
jgi:hypothetical protein